jgi:hypothetical protein
MARIWQEVRISTIHVVFAPDRLESAHELVPVLAPPQYMDRTQARGPYRIRIGSVEYIRQLG